MLSLSQIWATMSDRPLSERVRAEADEWRRAFDLGDVVDTCENYLRELADEIATLEAERDLFRSAVNDLVPRIERLERTAAALEGGDDE